MTDLNHYHAWVKELAASSDQDDQELAALLEEVHAYDKDDDE